MNTTKRKTLIKYLLHDYAHTILFVYICIFILLALSFISNNLISARVKFTRFDSNGFELITIITIFVIGLNSFKENFKFFSANGVSRKTQFCTTATALAILAVIFALIDTINCIIIKQTINLLPMFLQFYGSRFGYASMTYDPSISLVLTPQILFENFLWLTFLHFFISMVGLFITTLYYRMNKGLKIAVSIAIPTVLINGVQALDAFFLGGKIGASLQSFFNAAFGFSNGYNPYIGMFSMFVFAAVFSSLAFLLARKSAVKE